MRSIVLYMLLTGSIVFATALLSATIESVETYGAFETAGVVIKLADHNRNETARIYIDGTEAHPFIRYDGNHLATSLFNLSPGTTYNLRIDLTDPDGADDTETAMVTTLSAYSIPQALNTYEVSSSVDLQTRINNAVAGDRIAAAAGDYSTMVSISGINGTEANPVVITAADSANRPHFLNGMSIYQSSHLVFDHLEVEVQSANYSGGYGGMDFRGAHHIVITNCYVHDCDAFGDYSANIFIEHNDENAGADMTGNFIIINNVISDENPPSWPWDDTESSAGAVGHTYVGIKMDFSPGGYYIICRNLIYGVVDGIAPGGDEGQTPVLGLDDNDVLATWGNREIDIYDNVIYHLRDDPIELDGHICNARVFRNRLGECQNAVSTAPIYPGPVFIVRNYLYGFKEGAHKFNTAVGGETRNIYWYNNTVKQHSNGQWLLYRGFITDGTRNGVFKNNIFMATGPVFDCDITGSYLNQAYDYNLSYSSRNGRRWNGNEYHYGETMGSGVNYATWADFRDGTGQEANGSYGEASLSSTAVVSMPSLSYIPGMDNVPAIPTEQYFIHDLGLQAGSEGIDDGVHIPGITDGYGGSAPDCGAREYGGDDDGDGGGDGELFDEYILVQNPDASATASVTMIFMCTDGNTTTHSFTVAPNCRHTVHVDSILSGYSLSTKVMSDIGVIAERAMYWDSGGVEWSGGHCSVGATAAATTWYLAEGSTKGEFDEYLCIQNPSASTASVTLTLMTPNGSTQQTSLSIAPTSRKTVKIGDLLTDEVSVKLESDVGVIAERAMYWNSGGNNWIGGHCSIGSTAPAATWYLAEGCTKENFDEFICIQNPGTNAAQVTITFMRPDGTTVVTTRTISATSRETINAGQYLVDDVSTRVESDQGVVVERAMYWDAGGIDWVGGHCSPGVTAMATTWYLAEGCTSGNFDEFICIQNPNNEAAAVTITFMQADETTVTTTRTIGATSRETINVKNYVEAEVSTKVESSVGVIVERAMYWNAGGISWAGGHCSPGVTAAATNWYLAEGST